MEIGYKPTTHGRALLAALLALEKPLKISRVAFGSGRVPDGTNLADVHELVHYVADGTVEERRHEEDRYYMTVQYANASPEGHRTIPLFYIGEFMVYATDPTTGEEVDLLYATLGDYQTPMPKYSTTQGAVVFNLPLVLVVSDEIEVTIDAEAGLITYEDMQECVDEAVKEALDELQPGWSVAGSVQLTIPVDGWTEASEPCEDYSYTCDVAAEGVTGAMIPLGGPIPGYFGIAQRADMLNGCNVLNGKIRFMAKNIPEDKIVCKINLLRMGGSGGGGGNVDPGVGLGWGMDGRLNVLLGDGLSTDEENKINVNHEEVVTDTDMVDEEEAKRDIERILTGDEAESEDA